MIYHYYRIKVVLQSVIVIIILKNETTHERIYFVLFTEQISMLDMPYAICSLILGEERKFKMVFGKVFFGFWQNWTYRYKIQIFCSLNSLVEILFVKNHDDKTLLHWLFVKMRRFLMFCSSEYIWFVYLVPLCECLH